MSSAAWSSFLSSMKLKSQKASNDGGSSNDSWSVGFIVLVVLVVIAAAILAYMWYYQQSPTMIWSSVISTIGLGGKSGGFPAMRGFHARTPRIHA